MADIRYQVHNFSNTDNDDIRFLFLSTGKITIVKAIEYTYVQDHNDGRRIFNLGFGDYDYETGSIDDSANSNNRDVYKVFNTVLSTIPEFFKAHPKAIMMVEGSDSKPAFTENCKLTCRKHCAVAENCKNKHRRINVYREYVNRNYYSLIEDYLFFGGTMVNEEREIEPYVLQKTYDAVFVIKK